MKYVKMLGLAAVAAMALTAVTAGSASATTLEVGGVAKNSAITIAASAASTITLSDTAGFSANRCSVSSVHGTTSVFSGTKVTGSLSTTAGVGLSFGTCEVSPVTVESPGGLYIEHEASNTSGIVFSENTAVTWNTSFGFHVTCTTPASGRGIGTLDGVGSSSAHATMTIAAVLSCGFLLPSASWSATYKISTPTGLGVTS
jgi:hypothetical protein